MADTEDELRRLGDNLLLNEDDSGVDDSLISPPNNVNTVSAPFVSSNPRPSNVQPTAAKLEHGNDDENDDFIPRPQKPSILQRPVAKKGRELRKNDGFAVSERSIHSEGESDHIVTKSILGRAGKGFNKQDIGRNRFSNSAVLNNQNILNGNSGKVMSPKDQNSRGRPKENLGRSRPEISDIKIIPIQKTLDPILPHYHELDDSTLDSDAIAEDGDRKTASIQRKPSVTTPSSSTRAMDTSNRLPRFVSDPPIDSGTDVAYERDGRRWVDERSSQTQAQAQNQTQKTPEKAPITITVSETLRRIDERLKTDWPKTPAEHMDKFTEILSRAAHAIQGPQQKGAATSIATYLDIVFPILRMMFNVKGSTDSENTIGPEIAMMYMYASMIICDEIVIEQQKSNMEAKNAIMEQCMPSLRLSSIEREHARREMEAIHLLQDSSDGQFISKRQVKKIVRPQQVANDTATETDTAVENSVISLSKDHDRRQIKPRRSNLSQNRQESIPPVGCHYNRPQDVQASDAKEVRQSTAPTENDEQIIRTFDDLKAAYLQHIERGGNDNDFYSKGYFNNSQQFWDFKNVVIEKKNGGCMVM